MAGLFDDRKVHASRLTRILKVKSITIILIFLNGIFVLGAQFLFSFFFAEKSWIAYFAILELVLVGIFAIESLFLGIFSLIAGKKLPRPELKKFGLYYTLGSSVTYIFGIFFFIASFGEFAAFYNSLLDPMSLYFPDYFVFYYFDNEVQFYTFSTMFFGLLGIGGSWRQLYNFFGKYGNKESKRASAGATMMMLSVILMYLPFVFVLSVPLISLSFLLLSKGFKSMCDMDMKDFSNRKPILTVKFSKEGIKLGGPMAEDYNKNLEIQKVREQLYLQQKENMTGSPNMNVNFCPNCHTMKMPKDLKCTSCGFDFTQ